MAFDILCKLAVSLVDLHRLPGALHSGHTLHVDGMHSADMASKLHFMQRSMLLCLLRRRDHGWVHTLLEEAENERMHLLTFLAMKQPGPIFRGLVLLGQVGS